MTVKPPLILTPEPGNSLVRREMAAAFTRAGCAVHTLPEDTAPERIARILTLPPKRSGLPGWPDLYCSINFAGLDKYGETANLLLRKGIPTAVWCVDNPWNLLAGLRTDFWKKLFLFVTDPGFVPQLTAHGAQHATFLPLAADSTTAALPPSPVRPMQPVVFVGRSRFPDKERFFVGQETPPELCHKALALTDKGTRPDFAWWCAALGLSTEKELWPGGAVRRASLGAETCSLRWRQRCLESAVAPGLTIFGDADWESLFPNATVDIRPPVDYYTALPAIYRAAAFSLNMTSFLLPHGLNQRHFDVWTANGFCLLDATPGLDLFPASLTAPVSFTRPSQIPDLTAYFHAHPDEKQTLAAAWKKHILAEHTYDERVRQMITVLFP